ncbi:MAG: hypothetical protein FWC88_05390, partial [Endomicrobia bacterium]|nr:hypothetical protein [Endomicrobiia bacterium]
NESNKKELTDKAGQLIRNFEWKKDLGHIYNDTIFYNEELQAYVTAVYLIMVADHPSFIGRENPAIFKAITEARFDAKYRNADSSLSFGKDYFMQERNQAIFPEIIAHELAHIHLFKLKFLPIKKIAYLLFFLPYNNKLVRKIVLNLQKSMIHELYADVAGYLLASSTGRNPEKFYDSGIAPYLGKNISDFSEEPEEHAGARVQFNQLINMLRHDRREIDYYKFSEIFNRRLRRNIKKSDLYFKEFFFELSESYLTREGYRAVGEPEDLKNNDIITTQELLDSFRASVFGDEYAGIAPFWEWVYMLPGVSFFAESRLFSKILSKTLLKDKSEEEINNTLRTNRIAKTLDIAGSVVLGVCALSGLGIAGLAAFILTRAIIFSSVPKGYDWKAHWKDKALISVLLFFVPFAVVFASLQFFSLNFIPVIAAGFSLNILLHSVYNKFIAPALSLKKASVFKNLSQEEKQQFVADIIKLKLSSKLNIGVENININAVDNDRYYKKETYAEFFYNGVKLYKDESGKFISDIPKTFLLSLYGLSGSGRETYIETFVKNLIDIYNIEQQESSHKKISDFINGLDGGIADFAVTALLEFAASSAVTVPSFYLVENMSREIYTSSFNLSPVNFDMMYFISKIEEQIKEFDDDIKNLILFQCIEFTGYVLQSQTWLSPALFDGQYGYMQNIVNESYERELSNTKSFDGVFKIMLSNHKEVRMIKTKEAALFEYITIKNNERGSSLIIPDSIVSNFKNIDIASLEDKVYSSYDLEERTASVIRQKSSRGITDRYLIIDCSSTENIAAIAAKIDEYNKSVPEKLKIKEVMLYNADLKDYVLSYKDFTFSTAYVFDFSKFVFDDKNKEKILSLFTNIPAVYSGSDDFVLNYGSRLDNFTKHYLYMLMDIDLIRHGTHHVDMKIAKRIDNAPVQMKTAKEYKDLYDKLIVSLKKYNYFDGAKQIFYKYVTETALRNRGKLDAFIGGNDITASVFNGIIDEYRTLLNFMFYFKWSDRKDMGNKVSENE